MIWLLIISMAERMGLIIAIAFLFTRWTRFRQLLDQKPSNEEKLVLAVIFGLFGIIGTYTGITISPGEVQHQFPGELAYEDAIASSRAIGVIVAGLLGGPITGVGAALIAGTHRVLLGGFTALACSVSTLYEGLLGGLFYKILGQKKSNPVKTALLAGLLGEIGQMLIILMIAKPFSKAWQLVQIIAAPMIIANSLGIALFIAIIQIIMENDRRVGTVYAQKALTIANKTLPHLRTGLNEKSALATAQIIYDETNVVAVAITDREKILAHVGQGADHHLAGEAILTEVTKQVLKNKELKIAANPSEIVCRHPHCPLQSAIVVPLTGSRQIFGSFKLYFANRKIPDKFMIELAQGLAHLFSTQLELAAAEKQARLLQDAEIKALQAQINPHFLFNAINTVVALIRTNPATARKVLVSLGSYIRQNLKSSLNKWNTLENELKHVQAYLTVVQARFSNKLQVEIDIPQNLYHLLLPPLTLQPLVENAVQHGFDKITEQSAVAICAVQKNNYALIQVKDNGKGIAPEILPTLLEPEKRKTTDGIGLINVHSRLVGLFGAHCGLQIKSTLGEGTTVTFKLPINTREEH